MLGLELAPRVLLQPSIEDVARLLQTCRTQKDRVSALRLSAYIRKSGLEAHMSIGNHLVSMLVDVGSMHSAREVFDRLVYRDESCWDTLITGYLICEKPHQALALFQKMLEEKSIYPTGHTFVALLKVCAKLQNMERALKMHVEAEVLGLPQTDPFVGSAVVDMLAKCSSLAKAEQAFRKFNTQNAVIWNALITAYVNNDCCGEALKCFQQMQLEGVCPTAATYVCSLKSCGYLKNVEKGRALHAEIDRKGLLESDVLVGSSLVD
eukprot:c21847_g1_i1 orf=676-1470(+)